jgi:predicted DNA-binding antitoxin AbrB/MazE fold protein
MSETKTLHAVFDGAVLKPMMPVDLKVGTRYVLTVESKQEVIDVEKDPAFNLSSLAVKTNISDLSTEHDHYLYGLPRRGSDGDQ